MRHRVLKLLLRQGIVDSGGRTWNSSHETWLRAQRFTNTSLQLAYDTALMLATSERRQRRDGAIAELAGDSAYTPVATRLGCLLGVFT